MWSVGSCGSVGSCAMPRQQATLRAGHGHRVTYDGTNGLPVPRHAHHPHATAMPVVSCRPAAQGPSMARGGTWAFHGASTSSVAVRPSSSDDVDTALSGPLDFPLARKS